MSEQDGHWEMREAWERASAVYLQRRGNDVKSISYGNLAPDEQKLGLLGDIHGKRLLDLGCGGGQNSVSCALAGAEVVGVDVSIAQLNAAALLANSHGVCVTWLCQDVAALGDEFRNIFDLVLAIQLLPYVDAPDGALRVAASCLRSGGTLVMSVDHPVRNCFYDAEMEELSPFPVRDYFDTTPVDWNFAEGVPMRTRHYPLHQWIDWALAAGLQIERLFEAPAPQEIAEELWPQDSALAPLHNIPHTLIMKFART
jgi:SAM-dependent methyltransferase